MIQLPAIIKFSMNETLKWKGLRPMRAAPKTPHTAVWMKPWNERDWDMRFSKSRQRVLYEWNPEMKGIETHKSFMETITNKYEWNPEMKGIETRQNPNSSLTYPRMNETLKWKGLRPADSPDQHFCIVWMKPWNERDWDNQDNIYYSSLSVWMKPWNERDWDLSAR